MGVLMYGLGLNKQVGTKMHCSGSKIYPYKLVQLEENYLLPVYFLIKNLLDVKIKKTELQVYFNGLNLKTLLFRVLLIKMIFIENRLVTNKFSLSMGEI